MATVGWRTGSPLNEEIKGGCQQFDFFQLVRLLLFPATRDERKGTLDRLDKRVRFCADTRQDFSPAAVTEYTVPKRKDRPVELKLSSFCLDNRSGPLPETYRELLLERKSRRDYAMADFLSIFNHRLNALRFFAKKKRSITMQDQKPEDTPQTRYLLNLIGLGTPHLLEQLPLGIDQLMAFSGLLVNPRRSLPVVRNIVSAYLGAVVRIKQFTGHWNRLEEESQTSIGVSGQNQCLGKDTILGNRIWDQHRLITLEIGPLSYEKMLGLQIGSDGYRHFRQLLAYLLNRQCDCKVVIKVEKDEIPASVLHRHEARGRSPASPMILGRTSWLKSKSVGQEGEVDSQLSFVMVLEKE